MPALVLATAALVPAFLLLWFFVSRDANPEPRGVLARTFLLGVLGPIPVVPLAMVLEGAGASLGGAYGGAFSQAVLGAAIPEELFKFAVLRFYVWKHPAFDEPMDGIVYGATASLGFAALENLLYVGSGGTGVAILRAFTAVPGHATWGAIMGAHVGRARFAPPEQARGIMVRGVLWCIALHGAYDFLLFTKSMLALLAPIVLVFGFVWVWRILRAARTEQKLRVATERVEVFGTGDSASVLVETSVAEVTLRRTPWGVIKMLLGGTGLTAAGLFDCLMIFGLFDRTIEPDARLALGVMGGLTLLVGVGFFFLFRSGLRAQVRA